MPKDFSKFQEDLLDNGLLNEIVAFYADENGEVENSLAVSSSIAIDLLREYHDWLQSWFL